MITDYPARKSFSKVSDAEIGLSPTFPVSKFSLCVREWWMRPHSLSPWTNFLPPDIPRIPQGAYPTAAYE